MKMKYVIFALLLTLINLKENGYRALSITENALNVNCSTTIDHSCNPNSDYPLLCRYKCNDSMFCEIDENGNIELCCKNITDNGCPS